MNFARNFIDDLLLPWGVERIIYMDVDTIVQVRLAEETQHPLPRPP
jgi:lipopolysaccharide biosynthesis glycosyltransferase